MAVEVTVVVRFEHPPDEQEVRNAVEDSFDDAIVIEYMEDGV